VPDRNTKDRVLIYLQILSSPVKLRAPIQVLVNVLLLEEKAHLRGKILLRLTISLKAVSIIRKCIPSSTHPTHTDPKTLDRHTTRRIMNIKEDRAHTLL
jgi:hypothetical protein